MIHLGDCVTVMAGMEAESVDAVCTDPPYGLEFMGKGWDKFVASAKFGTKVYKDGSTASLPNFHGADNPTCRNCGGLQSGRDGKKGQKPCRCEAPRFDTANSLRRMSSFQAWCEAWGREALRVTKPGGYLLAFGGTRTHHRLVCGLEDAGWIIRDELTWVYASGFPKGKANLKPAHEPIVLARKPGPLRPLAIDAGRISTEGETISVPQSDPGKRGGTVGTDLGISRASVEDFQAAQRASADRTQTLGRWPSNVMLSDPALFDEPNPEVVGSGATARSAGDYPSESATSGLFRDLSQGQLYGDSGGYSRFFLIPKAGRSDREPVLRPDGHEAGKRFSTHPTMKPVDLMRHLIRLVTPPGGTVLDCFLGSGTTAIACEMEGFPWVGIEKEPEYVAIAEARLNGVQRGLGLAG